MAIEKNENKTNAKLIAYVGCRTSWQDQKAFSASEKKTVERIFLVKKRLPAYNGWCAH
ncbi:hypothetical protein M493_05885 [Geobacillus genomosp. 3]|uniref:Uncharacterized protein n=1 Tax=Geobacillus genomosp. 3 TaxID=1921421 RepID=S5ZBH7_GEOG3|nr:hypothetical protein M493_05885 [Geobacillus genomosp. 3]